MIYFLLVDTTNYTAPQVNNGYVYKIRNYNSFKI
jgi:hypothetical protein